MAPAHTEGGGQRSVGPCPGEEESHAEPQSRRAEQRSRGQKQVAEGLPWLWPPLPLWFFSAPLRLGVMPSSPPSRNVGHPTVYLCYLHKSWGAYNRVCT